MFTEDGELTASAAPACGDSNRGNLSLRVNIDSVNIPALVAPGSCPILFRCGAHNPLNFDITRIYDISDIQKARFDLTKDQYDVLTTAVDHGYFNIPRDVDQEELADKLGVSHQAVSERLRRAVKGLAENAVHSDVDDPSSFDK